MRSRFLAFALLLTACADESEPLKGIPCELGPLVGDDVSYDPLTMACVEIEMDPDEYVELSDEYRWGEDEDDQWPGVISSTAISCSEPYPGDYSYFSADIKVDGRESTNVGIRKKGFIGSVVGAGDRPSLKVKTDEFVSGQNMGDTERITLNNNHQDASRMRTCLAYSVFEDAGYPTPRCNLANVSVNGVSMGTYTHVESVKKRFLRRAFGNDDGSLYEGVLADFTDGHLDGLPNNLGRFESKTSDTDPKGYRLRALADALQAPDDELEASLEQVLDIDAFLLFWALETVIDHEDGYNSNTNNFYLYFDPDRGGRAVFIPWGVDGTFWGGEPYFATSELARRISRHPVLGPRLLAELQFVLDEVWDEDLLNERIDLFAGQVETAEKDLEGLDWSVDQMQDWIGGRRGLLEKYIANGGSKGTKEPGTCTGNRDPQDFLILGEIATVSSMGCSTAPQPPALALMVLFFLGFRRARSSRI